MQWGCRVLKLRWVLGTFKNASFPRKRKWGWCRLSTSLWQCIPGLGTEGTMMICVACRFIHRDCEWQCVVCLFVDRSCPVLCSVVFWCRVLCCPVTMSSVCCWQSFVRLVLPLYATATTHRLLSISVLSVQNNISCVYVPCDCSVVQVITSGPVWWWSKWWTISNAVSYKAKATFDRIRPAVNDVIVKSTDAIHPYCLSLPSEV